LKTNIETDLFTILFSAVAGDKRNGIGMRLVKVRNLLGPGHDVWVGKTEVTQREYKAVMGDNPSEPPVADDYPVEKVSWQQANAFCEKLTQLDKNPPTAVGKYSLPTHEQWSKYADVTDLSTNTAVYGRTNSAPVGSKLTTKHGLYDVWGNVSEWLVDSDPAKPENKEYIGGYFKTRPAFGGMGMFTNAQQLRLDQSFNSIGFRVIWVPGK
jgi:formylglycine-generating enzyme required for sulfatase activity